MRWWLLAALLSVPAAAQTRDDAEREKRVAAFAESNRLSGAKLYGALAEQGYIRHADVHAGPPDTLRFGAMVDGRPAVLLYLPAQAGDPPRPEGLYLESEDGAPRPLSPDARAGSFNQALAGAVRSGRRAPPPSGEDPRSLERVAREAKADPALRDAVAASFDGGARRRELESRIAAKEADIARQRAVSEAQWARTPGVASRVEARLRCAVPPAIGAGEIAQAARLDKPAALPPAPKSGRPAVLLVVSGEEDGARAQKALEAHKAAVKKELMERLRKDPIGGAADLLNAPKRNPESAVAVVDASAGLQDGARRATEGLAELPHIGAGVGAARDPGQAAKGERFVDRPFLFGRIARRKIDRSADVGEASARFAQERAGIVAHAGDVAALEVLKARERISGSFAKAGFKGAPVLAVGDPAASASLTAQVGGRGAFLQYRTADGGSYFLPLTPDPALVRGRADWAEVAARADARVGALSRSGGLTRAAALSAWQAELASSWGLAPAEAAHLASRLHGGR